MRRARKAPPQEIRRDSRPRPDLGSHTAAAGGGSHRALRCITALRGVGFEVRRGELVALLGANGAGKSTALRAISRLVKASGGRILWQGADLAPLTTERTVKLGIGHCPEGRRVLARQCVAANLELGAWLRRDRAVVLESGSVRLQGNAAELLGDRELQNHYLGSGLDC